MMETVPKILAEKWKKMAFSPFFCLSDIEPLIGGFCFADLAEVTYHLGLDWSS